jgi:HD-GYP domain-containing protein (c-di-GMP phosphodiesterase class II)
MTIADALDIIHDGRGTQFDPNVVDAFTSQLDSITALYAGSAETLDTYDIGVVRSTGDLSMAAA